MYKKNDDLFADISDTQTIFVDMQNGICYLIPSFANAVFLLLLGGVNLDDIKTIFSKVPEVPSDYAKRVDDVFAKLNEYHLIVPGHSDEAGRTSLSDTMIECLHTSDFVYNIKPSNDVYDLLMDDPIHDVSLDGWNPFEK